MNDSFDENLLIDFIDKNKNPLLPQFTKENSEQFFNQTKLCWFILCKDLED